MATVLKILGQVAPLATTETELYVCPALNETVISTLFVCNRSNVDTKFRVSVSEGGAATSNKDYIYYDVVVKGQDSFASTVGLTISAGDKIRVYSENVNLSFSLFGEETV